MDDKHAHDTPVDDEQEGFQEGNQEAEDEESWDWPLPHAEGRWKGKPDGRYIENAMYLLDRLGVTVRYNVMRRSIEIDGIEAQTKNAGMAALRNQAYRHGIPKDVFTEQVVEIADSNSYHPIIDWIESKEWDGVDRLEYWFDTVKHRADYDEDLKRRLMLTWGISAVKALFAPKGLNAQGVLVFQGDQGVKKTRWLLSLVPGDSGYAQDGLTLDPTDKDSIMRATTVWLGELGELDATFKKADIARIKQFVTSPVDRYRPPYGRDVEDFPRRSVYFASVNDPHFLNDPSGSRRWWVVPVDRCEADHGIDVQQLWAQLKWVYDNSGGASCPHWLDDETAAEVGGTNLTFTPEDPLESLLLSRCSFPAKGEAGEELRASSVLRKMLDLPSDAEVDGGKCRKLGKLLVKHKAHSRLLNGSPRYLVRIKSPAAGLFGHDD